MTETHRRGGGGSHGDVTLWPSPLEPLASSVSHDHPPASSAPETHSFVNVGWAPNAPRPTGMIPGTSSLYQYCSPAPSREDAFRESPCRHSSLSSRAPPTPPPSSLPPTGGLSTGVASAIKDRLERGTSLEPLPPSRVRYISASDEGPPLCIVCLGPFSDPLVCSLCGHCFCRGCLPIVGNTCLRCGNDRFHSVAVESEGEPSVLDPQGDGAPSAYWASPHGGSQRRPQPSSPSTTGPGGQEGATATYHHNQTAADSMAISTPSPQGKNTRGTYKTCPHCRWSGPFESYDGHLCTGPSEFVRDFKLASHPNTRACSTTGAVGGTESSPGKRLRAIDTSPEGKLWAQQLSQCLEGVKNNHLDPRAWYDLGECLCYGEDVAVMSSAVTKVGCYTTSLHLDPQNEEAWRGLGHALGPHEQCLVQGKTFTRRDCMVRALMLDDRGALDWVMLGTTIANDEVVLLPRTGKCVLPMRVSALECFRKALSLDPRCPVAYGHIATRLGHSQTLLVNGEVLTRVSAAKYAIALDSMVWWAWSALADALEIGEETTLLDGTVVGRGQCSGMADTYEKASLSSDSLFPQRWE